jgi:hypothetical protein
MELILEQRGPFVLWAAMMVGMMALLTLLEAW